MFKTQKALALAAMIAGGVSLAGDFDEVRLRTQLAGGPLGGIVASGSADFRLRPSRGDRSFNLEVEDLNLPAGTTLQVWVNNEPIGRLVVSGPPARGGEIELSSRDGAAVPKLEAGDVVSLRSNAGTLLSGVLQRRVLDDSPVNAAPTAAPVLAASVPDDKSVLRSPLTGGGLGGIRPSGEVEFRDDRLTRSTRLFVEVNDVNLRDGSEVEVEVNGRRMGKIRLSGSRRGGELELDSRNGERVESLKAGDMVRVVGPSGAILAGALQVRTFGDDRRPDDSASSSSSSSSGGNSAVSRVQSGLTGGAIGGVQPTGSVDFRVSGTDQKLSIEIEKLNLPAGTVVDVYVGDKVIGKITVGPPPMRGGELEINTRDGGVLPAFGAGEIVSVRTAAGGVLLTGVVQAKSFTEVPAVPGTKVDDPKGPNSGGGNGGSGSGNSGSGSGGSGSGSGNSGSGSGNSGSGSGNSGSGSGNSGSGSGNSGSGSGNSGSGSGNSGSGSGNSGSGSGNSGSGSGGSGSGSGNSGSGSGNSGSGSGNSGSGSGNSGSGSGNSGSGSGGSGSGSGNSGSGSGNSGSGSGNSGSGSGNSGSGSGNSGSGSGGSGSGSGSGGSGKN